MLQGLSWRCGDMEKIVQWLFPLLELQGSVVIYLTIIPESNVAIRCGHQSRFNYARTFLTQSTETSLSTDFEIYAVEL